MADKIELNKTYRLVGEKDYLANDTFNKLYKEKYFPEGVLSTNADTFRLDDEGNLRLTSDGEVLISLEDEAKFFEEVLPQEITTSHTHSINTDLSPNELCLKVQQLSDEVGCFIQFTPENKVYITHSYSDIELNCDCTEVEEVLESLKVLNKYI